MESSFEKMEIEKEREFVALIKKYPGQIEKGLRYLDHKLYAGSGYIDALFVDSSGVLAVAEIRIADDKGILMQALQYYDVVQKDRKKIVKKFPDAGIKIEDDPKIILVAPNFSDRVKKAARYVKPEIKLIKFEPIKHTNIVGGGLVGKEVKIQPSPFGILREAYNKVVSGILAIGNDKTDYGEQIVQKWRGKYFEPRRIINKLLVGQTYQEKDNTVSRNGFLVLTNRRLIWSQSEGILLKKMVVKFDISLNSLKDISVGGIINKKIKMIDANGVREFKLREVGDKKFPSFKEMIMKQKENLKEYSFQTV